MIKVLKNLPILLIFEKNAPTRYTVADMDVFNSHFSYAQDIESHQTITLKSVSFLQGHTMLGFKVGHIKDIETKQNTMTLRGMFYSAITGELTEPQQGKLGLQPHAKTFQKRSML